MIAMQINKESFDNFLGSKVFPCFLYIYPRVLNAAGAGGTYCIDYRCFGGLNLEGSGGLWRWTLRWMND